MADSVIGENRIAIHSATLSLGEGKMSVTSQYLDKDACESNIDTVKADQQTFEDYVHSLYIEDTLYA
jgi:hypothetical protein